MEESLKEVQSRKEFIEITPSSKVTLDLRYATTNNFTGINIYGVFDKAFLHFKAAEKLFKALDYLEQSYPGYKLILFDALRPRSVQYKLWGYVVGTEQEKYVADPKTGSMHNYGFAVDLSVLDNKGNELDMGTPFDEFSELSQPQLESQFLKEGKITQKHVDNRMILRDVMTKAGFIQLPHEWWHYDALPKSDVKTLYKIVE